MTNLHDARVEVAAKAMDENFNPDKYPIMAAMFRDYAEVAIAAADAVVPVEMIAAALHGDECPDDPDEGEACGCDGSSYMRQGEVVLALIRGGGEQ